MHQLAALQQLANLSSQLAGLSQLDAAPTALSRSNVNAVEEMTSVLALSKQFELHIKMMNTAKDDDQAMARVLQIS